MPKPKKPVIGTNRLKDIDASTYPEYDRANIPPVGMAQYDMAVSPEEKYEYDPRIDPSLQWMGKTSFTVPTSSIHIYESIKPHKIIRSVQTMGDDYTGPRGWLFESGAERAKRHNNTIEFYGLESLPFAVKDNTLIAVKIVDNWSIESLKIIPVREK
ncbi:MAG: hypothetical protein LBK13_10515 [Spirochaetales bacterium]|jgi:adenine-specific DNA-methyltransferase|nr:hypothetical protein [Spirochaetales bacterium]